MPVGAGKGGGQEGPGRPVAVTPLQTAPAPAAHFIHTPLPLLASVQPRAWAWHCALALFVLLIPKSMNLVLALITDLVQALSFDFQSLTVAKVMALTTTLCVAWFRLLLMQSQPLHPSLPRQGGGRSLLLLALCSALLLPISGERGGDP